MVNNTSAVMPMPSNSTTMVASPDMTSPRSGQSSMSTPRMKPFHVAVIVAPRSGWVPGENPVA